MIDGLLLLFVVLLWKPGRVEGLIARSHGESSSRKVCVVLDEPFLNEARTLASDLDIPTVSPDLIAEEVGNFHHLLRLVPFEVANEPITYALALESCEESPKPLQGDDDSPKPRRRKPKQKPKPKPFYVDLCPAENSQIGKRGTKEGGKDLLVKAVGPSKGVVCGSKGAVVYDLTAGLGQDSLVLALNGAIMVHLVERDPIVAALLKDAIRRLGILSCHQGSDLRAAMALELSKKMIVHQGDGAEVMAKLIASGTAPPPDVIYLDPMFPPRTKSAKVKKNMVLLHGLLDTQTTDEISDTKRLEEESRLLGQAFEATTGKVVVKRPARSLPLGDDSMPRPSYAIEGSVNRWDVYVKTRKH
jgi:16S rRNA (guanine1516-N2)-methyltransferase